MGEHKTVQSEGSTEQEDGGQGNDSAWQPTGLQAKTTQISRAGGVGGWDSLT